jgi:S-adenosylmethionine/arginine decarboxylase-like enzyme
MMDAFNGYRSRLDDIILVHEFVEELPVKLGLEAVMPPFILPYYNGIVPEDCGISAFVFLAGGHFTIHTFSFREAYFVDLVSPKSFDANNLENIVRETFPAERVASYLLEREKKESYPGNIAISETLDFGPHLFLDLDNYEGYASLDQLFDLFDALPFQIGMTPIMRPYAIKNTVRNVEAISVMTMIAESHISFHYFPDSKQAFLDLFSCRFFDYDEVSGKLKKMFKGDITNETLISRGSKYQQFKKAVVPKYACHGSWTENIYQKCMSAR